MKTYKMIKPNGEQVGVSSYADADRILGGFEPYVDKFMAEVGNIGSENDKHFAFLDTVADRWNANCAVLGDMNADDGLRLAERKAVAIQRAKAIKEMARECRNRSSGSEPQ